MILDDFRDAKTIYGEMLVEGHDAADLLNIVDKKLAEISGHIMVCHRVVAEHRGAAASSFLGLSRQKHLDKAEQAGEILESTIAVQSEFFDFRYKVLQYFVRSLKA